MDVGVRELRNGLSRYLARVQGGERITVTDRGRPVAFIVSPSSSDPLPRLVAEGLVTPAVRPKSPAPAPVDIGVPLSDIVLAERQ
jgi:prevent-host-death family protein